MVLLPTVDFHRSTTARWLADTEPQFNSTIQNKCSPFSVYFHNNPWICYKPLKYSPVWVGKCMSYPWNHPLFRIQWRRQFITARSFVLVEGGREMRELLGFLSLRVLCCRRADGFVLSEWIPANDKEEGSITFCGKVCQFRVCSRSVQSCRKDFKSPRVRRRPTTSWIGRAFHYPYLPLSEWDY